MTYYIEQDGQIKLHDTDRNRLATTLKFMPQYMVENPETHQKELPEILETERPIENCEWADTPEYIAKKHKQEVSNQVAALEAQTGLVRPLREAITAGNIPVSDYVVNKVQQIETLAQELRDAIAAEED